MIADVEEGVTTFSRSLEDSLKEGGEDSRTEHERRRWEDALGVEDDVREFIFSLQRDSRAARTRNETRDATRDAPTPARNEASTSTASSPAPAPRSETASPPTSSGTYSSYQTAEDRAAHIKRQAEQRMAERLAALGLRPPPSKSAPAASQDRQVNDRALKAQEEDAKREQERQRRLEAEKNPPPAPTPRGVGKKPPPAPPTRGTKTRGNSTSSQKNAEAERALKEQQVNQEAQTKQLEYASSPNVKT